MNFTALLIVLGLGLDPTGITAQLNDCGIYDNYSDFEASTTFWLVIRTSRMNAGTLTSANAWTVGLSSAK